MSWNYNPNPGNWQGNSGYPNYPGDWYPNSPGYPQGNWGWNNFNPNYTSGDWGHGYNQGNWGGTWTSNQQPWSGQPGWYGNQNWGPGNQPWNQQGFGGYGTPWSSYGGSFSAPYQGYYQGYYGPGNYGAWNNGFNYPGYGTAYGYGPQASFGYGQGFGNYAFDENEGGYVGVGPQSYRRPDQRIEEDICDEMTADSYLDAHDVNVLVSSGIVTLSGTVPTRDMRRRAEEDADSVMGVTDVRNDLRVSQHAHDEAGMMTPEPTAQSQPRPRNAPR